MRGSKINRSLGGILLIVGLACLAVPTIAQDQHDQEAMMKAWEEASTPGEHHKQLESMVGKWNATMKMWWQGPDGPVMEESGTSEFAMILNGRFLRQDWHIQMMGKPVHGVGITGYDNFKKKYIQTWMDDSATAIYTSEGFYNPETKTMTFFGLMDEPMTGEHDKPVKYVSRTVDENTVVFEIFDLAMGDDYKSIEITYTRL